MSKGWEGWDEPAEAGGGRCQSWNQSGYWKGYQCGNGAQFTIGPEVCCQTHLRQALARNPGATVEDIIRPAQRLEGE